ncbi:MAG: pyridoxine 5'-phosphate synthase [Candidatus Brocadiia bacterium]
MVELSVNVDHVATVRQARGIDEPDPVAAAVLAEMGGADGITVHLREDRRHAQDRDVRVLRQTVHGEFNLEMACTEEMVGIACQVRPHLATLVPERREELTTEGGLDLVRCGPDLPGPLQRLRQAGIRVSFFIDPDEAQVRGARKLGADFVELHTGDYAHYRTWAESGEAYGRLCDAAQLARSLGLGVHAGHGLNYRNVRPVAEIEGMEALYIGHSIVGRAVLVGMERAVREMKALLA